MQCEGRYNNVNSYEFIQNVNRDIGGLAAMFDSTMALYQIMNAFDGFKVMTLDNTDAAVIQYTVKAEDPDAISNFIAIVNNNLMVTVYDHIYAASANLLADGQTILISLKDAGTPV